MSKRKRDLRTEIRNEAEAAKSLLANIRDIIGDDDQAEQDAIEGQTSLKELAVEAVDRIRELDSFDEAIGNQIDKLKGRRERLSNQSDLLKSALSNAMQTAEVDRLELATATLSRKAVAPKVIVTDESAIPSIYFKTPEPKLSLKDLGAALKGGDVIPGAQLSNGGETLQITGG
jgi:hypothetical protein